MLSDLLLGLAWLAIILIPAYVAFRQPVVSHNGYLDGYMGDSSKAAPGAKAAAKAGSES